MTGFLPVPPADPTPEQRPRPRGVRVVLPNDVTGTAYELGADGLRRWCVLDNGQSAWLEQARLEPLDGPTAWEREPERHPCVGQGGKCQNVGLHSCTRFAGYWCDDCRPWTPPPTPDPELTADALRRRAMAGR